jgi:dTDP-glucose 4,6-dehydratase
MRVLVAGGAGFLGGSLCAHLVARGDEVVCIDNLITGSADNIKPLAETGAFTFVEADISLPVTFDGCFDAIINLASPASPADFEPLALEILEVGSRGVSNLLELARAHTARFLQASTSEVYGQPLVHPQPETYWGNVNPIGIRSVYDEAKRFGEALTMAHHRRYGLEVSLARIFNTYGPGMRADDGRVISNFTSRAVRGEPLTVYGDGSQTRSFCYVDDLAKGLLALLDSRYPGPVNLGSEEELDMLSVARLVLEVSDSSSGIVFGPRPDDDPSVRRPDLTVARRELGWGPVTPFREGLAHTVRWFASRSPR